MPLVTTTGLNMTGERHDLVTLTVISTRGVSDKANMLTYQVRPRIFRREKDQPLVFPAECTIRLHFGPDQPFGLVAGGGRTTIRAVAAHALFDANTGAHSIESHEPLKPLEVTLEAPGQTVRLAGATFSVTQKMESLAQLEESILSLFFGMPVLLNVSFADPPFIQRVDGMVGQSPFRWELSDWHATFWTTTQIDQEKNVARAWERMIVLAEPGRRRLVAALHYFHVATRLAREGRTVGEFLAEVILNLAKTLQVLFPRSGDVGTLDAARQGLKGLDLTEDEIEGQLLPAIALRNQIDVGHVELGLFTMEQLQVIHGYTERAENAFRALLERVLTRIEEGKWDVTRYELGSARKEATQVIERLRKYAAKKAE